MRDSGATLVSEPIQFFSLADACVPLIDRRAGRDETFRRFSSFFSVLYKNLIPEGSNFQC